MRSKLNNSQDVTIQDGKAVKIIGIINNIKNYIQNVIQKWHFMSIEDLYGNIEDRCFLIGYIQL